MIVITQGEENPSFVQARIDKTGWAVERPTEAEATEALARHWLARKMKVEPGEVDQAAIDAFMAEHQKEATEKGGFDDLVDSLTAEIEFLESRVDGIQNITTLPQVLTVLERLTRNQIRILKGMRFITRRLN